jgi:hypothetical protein
MKKAFLLACIEHLTMLFEMEQQFTEQVASPKDKVPLHEEPLKEMDVILADMEDMRA